MTWFDFALISLACYRVTRFTSLDSLIEEPRDAIVKWLLKGDSYMEGDEQWPFSWWRRKIKQWIDCPYCQSVWFAAGLFAMWWFWGDTTAVRWIIDILAIAGASMIVYRFTDPSPPCLPRTPCD